MSITTFIESHPILTTVGALSAASSALFLWRLSSVTSPTSRKPWDSWPPKVIVTPPKESGIEIQLCKEKEAGEGGRQVEIETWVCKASSTTNNNNKEKPPIVFVPGGFHSACCYENYLPYFSQRGFDCYAVSVRDHGRSSKFPGKEMFHTLKDNAWDVGVVVGRVLRETGKAPIIFGHSKGSIIVQHFLTYPPDNVSSFQEICSAFVHFNGFPPAPNEFLPFVNWAKTDAFNLFMGVLTMNPFWSLKTPEVAARVFYSSATSKEHARKEWEKIERIEAGPDADSFKRPFAIPETVIRRASGKVVVVGAEEDVLMTPEVVGKTVESYQRGADKLGKDEGVVIVKRVTVPGAHCHFVEEKIWEQGAKIIADALEEL